MDGGNHYDGAGGYSGAGGQDNSNPGYNGLGGGENLEDLTSYSGNSGTGGGGYYSSGNGRTKFSLGMAKIGGQCGGPCSPNYTNIQYYKDIAGSGGNAGAGGKVYYTDVKNIFAYNGNMITNGDYSNVFEYNKDGTQTTNKLETIQKPNGEKTIPAKIFAQSGTIRATYTTNQGTYTLSKVTRKLDEEEKLPAIADSYTKVELVNATNETPTDVTGYSNGYMTNQGIGSGAGYLEASNGIFKHISEKP